LFVKDWGEYAHYTSYKILELRVAYLSEGYEVSTTQSAGNWLIVANYDPQEAAFSNYDDAYNYNPRTEGVPFKSGYYDLVRSGVGFKKGFADKVYKINVSQNLPTPVGGTSSSVDDYSPALLQLIVNNTLASNTTEIGKWHLYAKIQVCGKKAQSPVTSSVFTHNQQTVIPTTANNTGTAKSISNSSTALTVLCAANVVTISSLPIGTGFQVTYVVTATTSVTQTSPPVLVGANPINMFISDTNNDVVSGSGNTTYTVITSCLSTASTFTLTYNLTIVAGLTVDITVVTIPNGLITTHQLRLASLRQQRLDRLLLLDESTDAYVYPQSVVSTISQQITAPSNTPFTPGYFSGRPGSA
jgi:hypothetical protein